MDGIHDLCFIIFHPAFPILTPTRPHAGDCQPPRAMEHSPIVVTVTASVAPAAPPSPPPIIPSISHLPFQEDKAPNDSLPLPPLPPPPLPLRLEETTTSITTTRQGHRFPPPPQPPPPRLSLHKTPTMERHHHQHDKRLLISLPSLESPPKTRGWPMTKATSSAVSSSPVLSTNKANSRH